MINIFEPNVGEDSLNILKDVFKSNWLGRGVYVDKFEDKLATFLNIHRLNLHTNACATDSIFGIFDILNLPKGSEVILPSISFPAVPSAILRSGLVPVIVDIDILTGNISLPAVKEALSEKTSAVFVTHYGGIPLDISALRELVGKNIKILEDAACALGSFRKDIAIGTEGDMGCWSFDAMKLLTCGEGGAIYLKSAEHLNLAKEYFYLGLPAQEKSGIDRKDLSSRWWEYQLNSPGRRSIFTNINAAIGLPAFDSLASNLARRQEIRNHYVATLDKKGITYLKQDEKGVTYSNYFFTILHSERDKLAEYLKKNGIYSTFRYFPVHLIDIFKSYSKDCSSAFNFSENALNIPIHHNLTEEDVELICKALDHFDYL